MKAWGELLLCVLILASCQTPFNGGKNVALLYGVSNYGGDVTSLLYPAADVEALAPLLNSSSGGVFPTVLARTDSDATRSQMQTDILSAASLVDSESLVLFYFGGHGLQGTSGSLGTDGHASIAPHDGDVLTAYNPAAMVTEDELRSWLAALPTQKIIVIIDACFSGGFIASPGGDDGSPQDSEAYYRELWKAFLAGNAPQAGEDLSQWFQSVTSDHTGALASWKKALAAGSGFAADQAQLLTAAGALEESYDAPQYQHGTFSYFLLGAKTQGDFDGNGFVTVSEAYRHTFEQIQTRWNGIWGAVGYANFFTNSAVFLPHLSSGPADYILFKK